MEVRGGGGGGGGGRVRSKREGNIHDIVCTCMYFWVLPIKQCIYILSRAHKNRRGEEERVTLIGAGGAGKIFERY